MSCEVTEENLRKCELTASHIFSLLYELEPYADLTARQPLLAARVPILDGPVMVHGEIVLGRLFLQRKSDCRPGAFGHYREFIPSVMQQQSNHRLGHLRIWRFGPHESLHV